MDGTKRPASGGSQSLYGGSEPVNVLERALSVDCTRKVCFNRSSSVCQDELGQDSPRLDVG